MIRYSKSGSSEKLNKTMPNTLHAPTAEAPEYTVPIAERFRKVTPTRRSPASSTPTAAGWQPAIADLRHPGGPGLHRPRRLPRRSAPISPSSARRPPSTPRPSRRSRRTGINVMVEKPFAASAADARRMIAAMEGRRPARGQLAARLVSVAQHRQAAGRRRRDRRADRGAFLRRQPRPALPPRRQGRGLARGGRAAEADLLVVQAARRGGGSLLDYLGYGTTLGTWFTDGEAPLEVTSVVDETPGIEVDQHSITVARYARGLSKFETRWGTLTDPWTHPAAAALRLRAGRPRRQHLELRLRRLRHAADPRGAGARCRCRPTRCPPAGAAPVEYMLARIDDGAPDRRPARPGALADRPAHDRQRRAVVAREARGGAGAMSETDLDTYALKAAAAAEVAAPDLPYRPPLPRAYRPRIALVGAGGIAAAHLARLPRGRLRRRGDLQPHAGPRRGAARRVLPRRRGDRRHRRARSPATTSRSSTSRRTRPSGCR